MNGWKSEKKTPVHRYRCRCMGIKMYLLYELAFMISSYTVLLCTNPVEILSRVLINYRLDLD